MAHTNSRGALMPCLSPLGHNHSPLARVKVPRPPEPRVDATPSLLSVRGSRHQELSAAAAYVLTCGVAPVAGINPTQHHTTARPGAKPCSQSDRFADAVGAAIASTSHGRSCCVACGPGLHVVLTQARAYQRGNANSAALTRFERQLHAEARALTDEGTLFSHSEQGSYIIRVPRLSVMVRDGAALMQAPSIAPHVCGVPGPSSGSA